MSVFTLLGAAIFKALMGNSKNNLFPYNIQKHLLYLHKPEHRAHLQKQKLLNYQNKNNVKATNHESIHKNLFELWTYLNQFTEEWKLKRCVNLYHWFVIGITFSYVKKIFGSVVSLHYGNTLFIFLFHLEGQLPLKTVLKF